MSFLALIVALILCNYFPHGRTEWLKHVYAAFVHLLERNFNDGKMQHAVFTWLLGVMLPALATVIIYLFLLKISTFLAFLLNVAVLYFLLRFSRFGIAATQTAIALRDKNIDQARKLLAESVKCDASAYHATEIARASIENTLLQAHYGLLAPIFWLAISGPAGVVLYCLALLFHQESRDVHDAQRNQFSGLAFTWLDWLPARVTASCFAIVGDFEDTVYCWREQAANWLDPAQGIILASGAGALGVKLGEPVFAGGVLQYRPGLGLGDEADADYMQSAVGLVWRVIILMASLMFLLTFANWLGD